MKLCKNGHDKDVVGVYKDGKCKVCIRIRQANYRTKNREKHLARCKAWYRSNSDKAKDVHLKRKYGISLEEFRILVSSQKGCCEICGRHPDSGSSLSVDHCHETGAIRDLLCGNCNKGLGNFQDYPDLLIKAAAYLIKHGKGENVRPEKPSQQATLVASGSNKQLRAVGDR